MSQLEDGNCLSSDAKPRKCNAKEDRFAREYVVDLEPKKAAIRAGYAKKAAGAQATRLLTRVWVQDRIEGLQAAAAGRMDLTADNVIARLMSVYQAAFDAKHYSAAVRAAELLGQRLGLFVKRIHMETETQSDEALSKEVIDAAVALAKGDKALKARLVAALGILDVVPERRSEEARPVSP